MRMKHRGKLLVLLLVVVAGLAFYFVRVYQPSSAEFLEIKHQEKLLNLPGGYWRYAAIDRGHWKCSSGSGEPAIYDCYERNIGIDYKSTHTASIRQELINKLLANHWQQANDKDPYPVDKTGQYDQTGRPRGDVYTASRDLFIKNTPQGRMCATVAEDYNANYQKDSPWLVGISLMGKTDSSCRDIK
jgi:hypothetical protein